jgi:hypothetical protein
MTQMAQIFLSVKSAESVDYYYFRRRPHEHKLNTINENPQMTQMAQIFLSVKSAESVDYFQRSKDEATRRTISG